MKKNNVFIRMLAIIGTIFAFIPMLATILTATLSTISSREFRFDYLLPAELGLFAIIGGLMLLLAAILSKVHLKQIITIYLLMLFMLIGSQVIAVLTGLASGAQEATGWRMTLVLGMLVVYALLTIVLGIAGIQLSRDLINTKQPA